MILSVNVKKKIYDVIKKYANSGATVIWEKQVEARPPKPYISLDLISGPNMVGQPDEYVDIADNKVIQVSMRQFTLSVNYFGQNAFAELGRVQESLKLPTARELFGQEDIVFIGDSGLRDLSALMENRFESRSQMDCEFRTTEVVKDQDTTVIETVILNNDIDGTLTTIS